MAPELPSVVRLRRAVVALDYGRIRSNPGDGRALARVPAYAPEPNAPEEGAWDRTGPEPRWRQSHKVLVRDALRSWKGDPVSMKLHIMDEEQGAPMPGSGTGKIQRAMAGALLWELEHHSRPSTHTLYRGSHVEPDGLESWSERKKVAELWASKRHGRVFVRAKGTPGLRVMDYTSSAFDSEREWVLKG